MTMLLNDWKKYYEVKPWFPNQEHLDLVKEAFNLSVRLQLFTNDCGVMTIEQALVGFEFSTSCGFNFCCLELGCSCHTKREFWHRHEPYVRSVISDIMNTGDCKSGVYFKASPKVEIRDTMKLLVKKKVRTFLTGDFIHTLVGRMLFKRQNDLFLGFSDSDDYSAMGVSIFYGGWDRMIRRFDAGRFDKRLACLDVSAMEVSQTEHMLDIVYDIRHEHMYDLENSHDRLFAWYYDNLVYTYLVDPQGFLCRKFGSMPSGGFTTLSDNCITMKFVVCYGISFCPGINSASDLLKAMNIIRIKVMGDDVIMEDKPYMDNDIVDLIQIKAIDLGFKIELEVERPTPFLDARFLNMTTVFDIKHAKYIFMPNVDKLLASIYLWRKHNSWRFTLAKLAGIRCMLWHTAYRSEIDKLIYYVVDKHTTHMIGETDFDEVLPMEMLQSVILSDHQMNQLLFGLECNPGQSQKDSSFEDLLRVFDLIKFDL